MGAAVDKALKQLVEAIKAEVIGSGAEPAAKAAPKAEKKAEKAPVKVAAKTSAKVAAKDSTSGYKTLSANDKIKAGDEWRLNGFKRSDGKENRWRKVGDSVGKKAGDFAKSVFRRKV